MAKTNKEILDETLALADKFYTSHGYVSRPGFRYDEARHPQERFMWVLACHAQDMLTGTDAQAAAEEADEEAEHGQPD